MFKKHVYTCPDIIFLRARQKKINIATLGVYTIFFGGMMAAGHVMEKRETEKLKNTLTPTEE